MRPDMIAGPIDRKCNRSNCVATGAPVVWASSVVANSATMAADVRMRVCMRGLVGMAFSEDVGERDETDADFVEADTTADRWRRRGGRESNVLESTDRVQRIVATTIGM